MRGGYIEFLTSSQILFLSVCFGKITAGERMLLCYVVLVRVKFEMNYFYNV